MLTFEKLCEHGRGKPGIIINIIISTEMKEFGQLLISWWRQVGRDTLTLGKVKETTAGRNPMVILPQIKAAGHKRNF